MSDRVISLRSTVVAAATASNEAIRGLASHAVVEFDRLSARDLVLRKGLLGRLAGAATIGRYYK